MADVLSMEDIRTEAARLNIDFSGVGWNSVLLPPGEDFGLKSDDDDDDDLNKEDMLDFDAALGSIIVVDNLPIVPREKYEKLERVVLKIYSQIGVIKENGLWMPVDEDTGKTRGYCFIEYNTPQEAKLAKEATNGYTLGKAYNSVTTFDEINKFMRVPDHWDPPEIKPYTPRENLQHWLTDEKGRDQFVIRAGSDTEVLWNNARQFKADLVHKQPFWTESFVQWSPLGTYLATVHRQGVAVWGGASTFNRLMRYAHPQVKFIDFSPGEKYLVTYSSHEPSNPPDTTHRVVLDIFDVRTGKVMKEFKGSADELAVGGTGGSTGVSWPVFKWRGGKEDKYFARMRKNVISVYETKTFNLVDEKSFKVENVMDFSWSPTDPVFALFVPELGGRNQPARVSLIQIPNKVELRHKNIFSVSDWQSNGDYLAIKLDRYTKTKNCTYTSFELFRIKERDIPIEVFELDNKNDNVIAFAWEPKGHRFAVIHGDNPMAPDVSFYSVKCGKVLKLTTLKQKQANALFWSPTGRFIILVGLKGFNGQLEFYNVDELVTMAIAEHFMANDIEWDPTGRYVATSVHEMENGFNIWSFNGKLLYRVLKDHFFQLLWRPRPPSFLSPEKEEEILKNLKKYSKKYDVQDEDMSVLLSEQDREKRKQVKDDWERWVREWKQCHEEEMMERQMLRDGEASDVEEGYEVKEDEVEELLDVSE